MNNKFIRALVVINGILIPLFILTIFGIFIGEFIITSSERFVGVEESVSPKYFIKYSSPQEITNSQNYFISKYNSDEIDELLGVPELRGGEVQENTMNLVFLNKNFERIGNLLESDGSVKKVYIPNFFSKNEEQQKLTKNIAYLIAIEDSNNDKVINKYDEHHLYISDLHGKDLKRVIDKRVKHFEFINDFEELMVTYYENHNDLAIGVYNIENSVFTKKSNLGFDN